MSECNRMLYPPDNEATTDPDLLLHAETCPDCRLQLRMDGKLRDLTLRIPHTTLSPGFNSTLRTLLAVEKRKRREHRRRVFLLRTYWVTAAALSLIALTRVRWPGDPSASTVYVLGSVLVCVLIVPVLLLLRRRGSLAGFLGCVFTGELRETEIGTW